MALPILRVASRESKLALWQTNVVMEKLQFLGFRSQLVPVKTTGDIDLIKPIYAMGIQGVFTKELDIALLNRQADLAVHSLKDIPTVLPKGLRIIAVLERASYHDILICKPGFNPLVREGVVIATSSIRRKSQWLYRFPAHTMVNVRGNVETRLGKFKSEGWDGIIFAKAGLERLGLLPNDFLVLDWMVPAPAQGAIAIVCREEDEVAITACRPINHEPTEVCVSIERNFLYHLEGGCSVPISALACYRGDQIHFEGAVHSIKGEDELKIEIAAHKNEWQTMGHQAATQIRYSEKGQRILDEFRRLGRN